MSKRGCDHFSDELVRLIDRMRQEYEMTYAEIIGCLELIKLSIAKEPEELDDNSE